MIVNKLPAKFCQHAHSFHGALSPLWVDVEVGQRFVAKAVYSVTISIDIGARLVSVQDWRRE